MERFYKIAGNIIRVCCLPGTKYPETGLMDEFEIESDDWDFQMNVGLVDELDSPEGELIYHDSSKRVYCTEEGQIRYKGSVEHSLDGAYLRWYRRGNQSDVQIKRAKYSNKVSQKVILDTMEAEHLIAANKGIILHASYVLYEGQAILFTAPSGTGKSTQAALWEKYCDAEVVNGDRTAIVIHEDGIWAEGIPFSGSSGICKNISAPLCAVVYLEQCSENIVSRLKGGMAFRALWEGCTVNLWDKGDIEKSIHTLEKVIMEVPVFKLKCTPDVQAIEALKKYI